MDDLPRGFHLTAEEGVADGLLGQQIHSPVEKRFQGRGKVEKTVRIFSSGEALAKTNQKIEVAAARVEWTPGGRAENIQALNPIPATKLGELRLLAFNQVNHCGKIAATKGRDNKFAASAALEIAMIWAVFTAPSIS